MIGGAGHERPPNRLALTTSPYLLQHARNPVDWYPWGPEALSRAAAEDRPILLSIGYAACHWCHVMERESFENDAIAEVMNRHYVCIKVDREERPDLDEIYMAATQAMNRGQGGWPMTVFLTPERRPFFAGTYFPPEDKWGRPGFRTLLDRIAELWTADRAAFLRRAQQLTEALEEEARTVAPGAITPDAIGAAVQQLAQSFDSQYGGFGGAPKFPPTAALRLLLRHHARSSGFAAGSADSRALVLARTTLDGMARGGMYDQVGGGFHRYSTDERWLAPHFEKMLYDNAGLAVAYVEAFQVTGNPFYRRIATETLDYILREMTGPEGGFWSSTDADSEGEEGKFFVWTPAEVAAVLGDEDAGLFCRVYDIEEGGNWEGHGIPNVRLPDEAAAKLFGLEPEELRRRLDAARSKLHAARSRRVPPGLDDKVLAGWNGMMIGAFAEGSRVLRKRTWLDAAERAAEFVLTALRRADGGLHRAWRAGQASHDAVLEDYAYLSDALVDLYEAGGAERWLREALGLAERMLADFADAETGGFFNTAKGHEALIIRRREGRDGATPNPGAVAARALLRLARHFDRADLRTAAERATQAWGKEVVRFPRAFCTTLLAVDMQASSPIEVAIVGAADVSATEALEAVLASRFLPNRVLAHHDPGAGPPPGDLPLLAGKMLVGGAPAAYVCREYACQAPVTTPDALRSAPSLTGV